MKTFKIQNHFHEAQNNASFKITFTQSVKVLASSLNFIFSTLPFCPHFSHQVQQICKDLLKKI
eukprot:UN22390